MSIFKGFDTIPDHELRYPEAQIVEKDSRDARIAELEAALRPFAKNADVWDAYSETQELVEPFNGDPRVSELTVADLRRARAALSTKEDGK